MYLEFEDFLFDCVARDLSPKTIKGYRNNTALFLKYVEEEFRKVKHLYFQGKEILDNYF